MTHSFPTRRSSDLALVFRDCRRVPKYAPVAAHDDDVGPLLKRRHAFDQGTEIVAVDESADVGFDAPVLPGCILGIGMPTQWHDARGPAASMGTGQEARGAGKEPDFVAMAFDDRRPARGEDVVAAADRCDAGFAEELPRPPEGAVAAVHGVIVGEIGCESCRARGCQ